MVCRTAVRHGEHLQSLRREPPESGAPERDCQRGPGDSEACSGRNMSNGNGQKVPPFPPEYRASGLLLHITSLPSRYGIGDLGSSAFSWINRLHDVGLAWWQALPLGPTGYGNSPYQSMSSFAGNTLLISP